MKFRDSLAYIIKHNSMVQYCYRLFGNFFFRSLGFFVKNNPKLILFSSYGGKNIGDSPKVLYDAMVDDSRFQDFQFVWAIENIKNDIKEEIVSVKIDSLKYFITALKAGIWITNVNIERGLSFKKSHTIYLNTWHGTGPKKGGNAVKGRKDYDFSNVDIFCCDGNYTRDVFKRWWNAKEENMIWCGRPREDELMSFSKKDRERFRKKLGILNGKTMILYMPTWREWEEKQLNYELWEKKLQEKYIIFIRAHHFSGNDFKYRKSDLWVDVSDYSNVNELYMSADILISDYSSAFFDYGLLGKPMFCYAYDYEKYINEYGLFIDLEKEFPNGVFKEEESLLESILNIDYEKECKIVDGFCKKYVTHSENATEKCIDEIVKKWRIINE